MPAIPFASMPDTARVWVFGAAQPLLGGEAERVVAAVTDFLAGWHAHGAPVVGAFDLRDERFLLIAADEAATGVSGCSIDSLYSSLREVERAAGITLLDSSPVWYRDDSRAVRMASRREFRELCRAGEVGRATRVFDNTVSTVGGVRNGEWERPLSSSWHGRAFA